MNNDETTITAESPHPSVVTAREENPAILPDGVTMPNLVTLITHLHEQEADRSTEGTVRTQSGGRITAEVTPITLSYADLASLSNTRHKVHPDESVSHASIFGTVENDASRDPGTPSFWATVVTAAGFGSAEDNLRVAKSYNRSPSAVQGSGGPSSVDQAWAHLQPHMALSAMRSLDPKVCLLVYENIFRQWFQVWQEVKGSYMVSVGNGQSATARETLLHHHWSNFKDGLALPGKEHEDHDAFVAEMQGLLGKDSSVKGDNVGGRG